MSTGPKSGQITGLHWYALRTRSRHEKMVRDQLSTMLGEQGITVARRTVAKYREALKLAPANLRKAR